MLKPLSQLFVKKPPPKASSKMIICHCNTVSDDTVRSAIKTVADSGPEAGKTLLDTVGHIWRESVDKAREHRNPLSCTACFNRIALMLQKENGLFVDEKIPPRSHDCASCPRVAQCRFMDKGL